MSPETSRTIALRRELVALVDASPALRRRSRRTTASVLVSVGVFGALIGGALSATAIDAPSGTVAEQQGLPELAVYDLDPGSLVYGQARVVSAAADTVVDMGEKPRSATTLAIVVSCLDPGDYQVEIDGRRDSMVTCREGAGTVEGDYLAVIANHTVVLTEGTHEVAVRTADGNRFELWVAWTQRIRPVLPDPSPQQEEALADGVVTEEEYLAGFERFRACLEEADVELMMLPQRGHFIEYGTRVADSAAVDACSAREFMEIEMEWQSAGTVSAEHIRIIRECLLEHDIDPRETWSRMLDQLHESELTETCTDRLPDQDG